LIDQLIERSHWQHQLSTSLIIGSQFNLTYIYYRATLC